MCSLRQIKRIILSLGVLCCVLVTASRSTFSHNQNAEQLSNNELLQKPSNSHLIIQDTHSSGNNETNISWSGAVSEKLQTLIFDYGDIDGKYHITEEWLFDGRFLSSNKLSGNSVFIIKNLDTGNITRINVSEVVHSEICDFKYNIEEQMHVCMIDNQSPSFLKHEINSMSQTQYGNILHANEISPISVFDFDKDNVSEIIISSAGQGTRHHDLHHIFELIDIDTFSKSDSRIDEDYTVPHFLLSYYFFFSHEGKVLFEIGPNSWCSGSGSYHVYQSYKYVHVGDASFQCDENSLESFDNQTKKFISDTIESRK